MSSPALRPLLVALLAAGCAATPRRPDPAPRPAAATSPDCAALAPLLARVDAATARAMGVALGSGAGERTLTGDPAVDEAVSSAEAVACVGDAAAALVRTDCGNATLVGFAWRDGRWAPAHHRALVELGRPGHCAESTVRVTRVALTDAAARELVVEARAENDVGDEGFGPNLEVVLLADHGALLAYGGTVSMGSFDPASGAATEGRWDIIEELPLPRDLYVELRPLHGGLGGEPIGREIQRETWRVRDLALVRVDLVRERVAGP